MYYSEEGAFVAQGGACWETWSKTPSVRTFYVNIDSFINGGTGTETLLMRVYSRYAGRIGTLSGFAGELYIGNIEAVKIAE